MIFERTLRSIFHMYPFFHLLQDGCRARWPCSPGRPYSNYTERLEGAASEAFGKSKKKAGRSPIRHGPKSGICAAGCLCFVLTETSVYQAAANFACIASKRSLQMEVEVKVYKSSFSLGRPETTQLTSNKA